MAEQDQSCTDTPVIIVNDDLNKDSEKNKASHHGGGILKKRGRIMKPEERDKRMSSGVQWDEFNILMTEHPPDKDYGHMKIEEPKTPFHEMIEDDESTVASTSANTNTSANTSDIQSDDITERVLLAADSGPRNYDQESGGSSDDETLTDEAKGKKQEFKKWRKAHYNEYMGVQRARQLMKEDEEELKRLEEMDNNNNS